MKIFKKIIKLVFILLFITILLYFFRYNEYNKHSFCCDGIKFLTYLIDNIFNLLKSYSFVLLIIFFFIRRSIVDLINRVKEFKSKELSFKFDDNMQNLTPTSNNIDWFNSYLQNEDLSKIVKEHYSTLKKNLKLKSLDATSDVLLKKLTDFSLALHFEKLYNVIFKSQAKAIMYLYNDKNKAYIEEDNFRKFNDKAYLDLPGFYQNYSYEKWLAFLLNNKFIKRRGSKIYIDYVGKAFCYYIIHQGYNIEYISLI